MSDFDYQQWRSASAVTPEMLDACLDRIAALEAELERVTGERDRYEKQRDRAEQKYDALLVQLPKSTDYEFEVFDAEDGMPGLRMVSYKDRAEQAEADLTVAREEARKWEWVGRRAVEWSFDDDDKLVGEVIQHDNQSTNFLLARYQPADEETS